MKDQAMSIDDAIDLKLRKYPKTVRSSLEKARNQLRTIPHDLMPLDTERRIESIAVELNNQLNGSKHRQHALLMFTGLAINEFDSILPLAGAVAGHAYTDGSGGTPYLPAASVYFARTQDVEAQTWDRVDVTFPYGFSFVYQPIGRTVNQNARVLLMGELLSAFGQPVSPPVTGTPASRRLEVSRNVPNPFNPSTSIAFSAPQAGPLTVRVYNLRGEVVRVLHDGPVDAGAGSVIWNGQDQRGNPVSSGVYLYEVSGFGERVTGKMALVK